MISDVMKFFFSIVKYLLLAVVIAILVIGLYILIVYQPEKVGQNYKRYNCLYIESEDFIEEKVNSYIDSKIDSFKANKGGKSKFSSAISRYRINEDVVSIVVKTKIITNIENRNVEEIEKRCFNFSLKDKKEIRLEDIFNASYKEVVGDKYSDNYVLLKNRILFYKDGESHSIKYSELLDYNISHYLSAKNYGISKDEYNKLFGK